MSVSLKAFTIRLADWHRALENWSEALLSRLSSKIRPSFHYFRFGVRGLVYGGAFSLSFEESHGFKRFRVSTNKMEFNSNSS